MTADSSSADICVARLYLSFTFPLSTKLKHVLNAWDSPVGPNCPPWRTFLLKTYPPSSIHVRVCPPKLKFPWTPNSKSEICFTRKLCKKKLWVCLLWHWEGRRLPPNLLSPKLQFMYFESDHNFHCTSIPATPLIYFNLLSASWAETINHWSAREWERGEWN